MLKIYNYEAFKESLKFFGITFIISWVAWFFAIYISWQPSMHHLLLPLVLFGLCGPALSTCIMLIKSRNKKLWYDFFQRLRLASIKSQFIPIVLFLFPGMIILAISFSLFFGQPIHQFHLITQSPDLLLQGKNFLTLLLVMLLIGPFEEIGWRGFGIDSLRKNFNLLQASLILGTMWGLWHVPLFFIKNGGLQQEFWNVGLFQTFIYFTGLFLITIITNWLYVKNNRSILIAILFHSIYDLCLNIFRITPITWFILWVLVLLTAIIIVQKNKDIFFKRYYEN